MSTDEKAANKAAVLRVRIPEALERRIYELASFHGRRPSEEVRIALAAHDMGSTLSYLASDEAVAELGEGIEQARERVRADLEELLTTAYARPSLDVSAGL